MMPNETKIIIAGSTVSCNRLYRKLYEKFKKIPAYPLKKWFR